MRETVTVQRALSMVGGSVWPHDDHGQESWPFDVFREPRVSAYELLYRWMVRENPRLDFAKLHNACVIGKKSMAFMQRLEVRRLRGCGLRGEELRRAVSWSNLNAAPQELLPSGQSVSGSVVLVLPRAWKSAELHA